MAGILPQIGLRLAVSKRHRRRYREITRALLSHGFGVLVTQLGLSRYVPFRFGIMEHHPRRAEPYTQAEHVRMVFEDLGTTFIKLGQVLSTRVDLIPLDYIHELEKLLDQVPPVSIEAIKQAIAQDLGRDTDAVFAYFDPGPLASASIGQVHAARLKTGEDVVVKVKRPGVQEQVEVDVSIIMELAHLAGRRIPALRNYDVVGIAREFTQTLLGELDYVQEGRNADRFRENFGEDERIHIPRIYWDYTSRDVITLERIYGVKINDKAAILHGGMDPRDVAKRSADILLEQVFKHGFFHADPHPANFFVMPGGVIGLVDFGMVGFIDEKTKGNLVELFLAVFSRNADAVVDAYIDLGVAGRVERLGELSSDIRMLIMRYYGLSLKEVDVRRVLNDVTSIVRQHNLRMPSELALLIKTISMEESLVLQLDPDFNFAEEMAPFARKVWMDTRSPLALIKRSLDALVDYAEISANAARPIRRILGQLSRGQLTIITNQPRLDEELAVLNSMVNKILAGIVSAAALIATGLLVPFISSYRRGRKGRNEPTE